MRGGGSESPPSSSSRGWGDGAGSFSECEPYGPEGRASPASQSPYADSTPWLAALAVLARAGASCSSNDPRMSPSKVGRLLAGAASSAGVFVRLPTDLRVVPGRFVRRERDRFVIDIPDEGGQGGYSTVVARPEDVGVLAWPGEADPARPLTWRGAIDWSTRRALRALEIQTGVSPPIAFLITAAGGLIGDNKRDDFVKGVGSLIKDQGVTGRIVEGDITYERLDTTVDPALLKAYETSLLGHSERGARRSRPRQARWRVRAGCQRAPQAVPATAGRAARQGSRTGGPAGAAGPGPHVGGGAGRPLGIAHESESREGSGRRRRSTTAGVGSGGAGRHVEGVRGPPRCAFLLA